jgi:hypothetical protein
MTVKEQKRMMNPMMKKKIKDETRENLLIQIYNKIKRKRARSCKL